MSELKTKPTSHDPAEFLKTVEPPEKQTDSFVLLEMMKKATGEKPKMWGTSMIGFGMYHYKSERSTQEGDWPLIGFSPRKQNLTLYLMTSFEDKEQLLKKLGPHSTGVSCLYIKRLSDIDIKILETIIEKSYAHAKQTLT